MPCNLYSKIGEYIEESKYDDVVLKWINRNNRKRNHNEKEIFTYLDELFLKLHNAINLIDIHYYTSEITRWYYRYKEYPDFLDKSILYAEKDISMYQTCMDAYSTGIYLTSNEFKNYRSCINGDTSIAYKGFISSFVYTFKQLITTYEKTKQYDQSIKKCTYAISLGLVDTTTKGGFEGKLIKIQNLKEKNQTKS